MRIMYAEIYNMHSLFSFTNDKRNSSSNSDPNVATRLCISNPITSLHRVWNVVARKHSKQIGRHHIDNALAIGPVTVCSKMETLSSVKPRRMGFLVDIIIMIIIISVIAQREF